MKIPTVGRVSQKAGAWKIYFFNLDYSPRTASTQSDEYLSRSGYDGASLFYCNSSRKAGKECCPISKGTRTRAHEHKALTNLWLGFEPLRAIFLCSPTGKVLLGTLPSVRGMIPTVNMLHVLSGLFYLMI